MLLTIKEAARQMSVSTKTVYRMFSREELHKVKVGRATRVSEKEMVGYLKKHGLEGV